MHISPFDNHNQPIVAANNACVPLNYFNVVHVQRGEHYDIHVPHFEICVVPAVGTIDVSVLEHLYESIGNRGENVWDGEPEGVYIPTGAQARLTCVSESARIFIAGARCADVFPPFAVRENNLDVVQYGSDDTKTHRKIKHILGQKQHGQVGRLLVSELFTVGQGGWSGFPPHKHDTDRPPCETHHDETYHFQFRPARGSGVQIIQGPAEAIGQAHHIQHGSTVCIARGYHPCCVLPGYEMYYFTILAGASQRPLIQYFQPDHADQIHTIPGILDMVAKFK